MNWKQLLASTAIVGGITAAALAQTMGPSPSTTSISAGQITTTGNTTQLGGNNINLGNGTTGTGTQRVTLSSDSTGQVSLATGANSIGNIGSITGALPAGANSIGTVVLGAGSATIGALTANQSVNEAQIAGTTTSVNNGTTDAGTRRVTLSSDSTGQVKLASGSSLSASTTGGATPYHLSGGTTASTNSSSIKGSAGTLYALTAINTTGTFGYLKVYDSAAAPTCSSATGIKHVFPVPTSTAGAGFVIPLADIGEIYSNGIGYCVTGGGTDTDNTNAPAGIFVEASFK